VKSRTPIVVGVAIAGLVIAVVFATRGETPPATRSAPGSLASMTASALEEERAAPSTARPTCADSCKAAARCGIAATTCVADCEGNSVVQVCVEKAFKDCHAAAMCTWKVVCQGNAPHGRGTCADALRCQMTNCPPGDFACGCKCASILAPSKALHLLRVDACAINCKFDNTCMAGQCKWLGDTCAMQ
jgi:hypothetical protein